MFDARIFVFAKLSTRRTSPRYTYIPVAPVCGFREEWMAAAAAWTQWETTNRPNRNVWRTRMRAFFNNSTTRNHRVVRARPTRNDKIFSKIILCFGVVFLWISVIQYYYHVQTRSSREKLLKKKKPLLRTLSVCFRLVRSAPIVPGRRSLLKQLLDARRGAICRFLYLRPKPDCWKRQKWTTRVAWIESKKTTHVDRFFKWF